MLETIDHPEHIRELRLARPPVNAINTELLRKIIAAVEGAAKESAIVFTGQPGLFSGGLDVRGMLDLDRDSVVAMAIEVWRVQRAIAACPVPVVFGIPGHSPAGGTVLAIHGDYRVMALGDFRIGLNEVAVGLFPGTVIHGAFRRLTGGHGAQLLSRGALIDSANALRVGLVDELCDASQVVARALEVAREMCALPREAMLRTRELARKDLLELFGNPGHALMKEREFGNAIAQFWFSAATQELARNKFAKK
jgi:enoyl-CoA hydratase/carnithine racemase